MNVEEFITEKAERFGDSELARIERAHRRAIAWLRVNLGKKPPRHIRRALDEARVLEELAAAQRDGEEREKYIREHHLNPNAIPPVPKAGKVAVTMNQSVGMLAALAAKRRRDG